MGLTFGRRMLLATVCSVAVATIYVAQPVLAQVGSNLSVPEADLGWIVAAGQVGYLVGLALLVPLGDIIDRRRLIVGHLILGAFAMLVAALAPSFWLLLAALAIAGLAAVVVQTTVAFAADLSAPAERGRTLGAVTSGVIIGILGGRVLAGSLATLWDGAASTSCSRPCSSRCPSSYCNSYPRIIAPSAPPMAAQWPHSEASSGSRCSSLAG